jgi:hypothetical protein
VREPVEQAESPIRRAQLRRHCRRDGVVDHVEIPAQIRPQCDKAETRAPSTPLARVCDQGAVLTRVIESAGTRWARNWGCYSSGTKDSRWGLQPHRDFRIAFSRRASIFQSEDNRNNDHRLDRFITALCRHEAPA